MEKQQQQIKKENHWNWSNKREIKLKGCKKKLVFQASEAPELLYYSLNVISLEVQSAANLFQHLR